MREERATGVVLDPLDTAAEQETSHTAWLRSEITKSIADPRPSVPHDEAMAHIRRTIEAAKRQQGSTK